MIGGMGRIKQTAWINLESVLWQHTIVQFIAAVPGWCSQVTGTSFSGATFLEVWPCTGHMAPSQQARPIAWYAEAQSGAQSSSTASRHAHAASLFPGALERWLARLILRKKQNTPPASVRKLSNIPMTGPPFRSGFLTLGPRKSQTQAMAHIYMQFDFGKDEAKAQAARHKLETWKQAFRLDKKLLYKVERTADGASAVEPVALKPATEKAQKPKGKSKGKAKEKDEPPPTLAPPSENVKLLLRLAFSSHEKLSEQRWVQRIPTEEPFQGASPLVLKTGDARFPEVEKQFENLT